VGALNWLLIVRDLRGYRVVNALEYDGAVFLVDGGDKIGKQAAFIADQSNIMLMAQGQPMRPPEDMYLLPLEPAPMIKMMENYGFGLDHELRIRRRMQNPWMAIKAGHIAPIVMAHVTYNEKNGKNPESQPLNLLWHDEAQKIAMLIGEDLFALPEAQNEIGHINLYDNKQVVLTFQDYHIVPKNSNVGTMIKFLKVDQTGADSVQELCGKDKFLTEDGILLKRGDAKLSMANLSIDDFLSGGA